jgi:hypothetical protein
MGVRVLWLMLSLAVMGLTACGGSGRDTPGQLRATSQSLETRLSFSLSGVDGVLFVQSVDVTATGLGSFLVRGELELLPQADTDAVAALVSERVLSTTNAESVAVDIKLTTNTTVTRMNGVVGARDTLQLMSVSSADLTAVANVTPDGFPFETTPAP